MIMYIHVQRSHLPQEHPQPARLAPRAPGGGGSHGGWASEAAGKGGAEGAVLGELVCDGGEGLAEAEETLQAQGINGQLRERGGNEQKETGRETDRQTDSMRKVAKLRKASRGLSGERVPPRPVSRRSAVCIRACACACIHICI
jgi:hypothetical protein